MAVLNMAKADATYGEPMFLMRPEGGPALGPHAVVEPLDELLEAAGIPTKARPE